MYLAFLFHEEKLGLLESLVMEILTTLPNAKQHNQSINATIIY
jgi:hypothetical protein